MQWDLVAYHTIQLSIQDVQLGICIVDHLVHVYIEGIILVSQSFGQVLLVDTVLVS